jgi:hypothetical protein
LIQRFIDKDPEVLYVPSDRVTTTAEETGAIPYDVPNVELTHVGELCSFDAFLGKYELTDPALRHPCAEREDQNRANHLKQEPSATPPHPVV